MITFCFGFPSLLPWAFVGTEEEEKAGRVESKEQLRDTLPRCSPVQAASAPLSRPHSACSSSPAGLCTQGRAAPHLNLPQDIQAFCDLPKHHVLAIQPIGLVARQEELGAVGVGAGVGHGEQACGREGARQPLPPALGPQRAVCAGEGAVEMLPKTAQDAGPGCRTGTGKTDAVGICGESGFSERWGSKSGCRGQTEQKAGVYATFQQVFPTRGSEARMTAHTSQGWFFLKIDTTRCSAAGLI